MRKKRKYEPEDDTVDLAFEQTIYYITTLVNLGYGVKVVDSRSKIVWYPEMGFSIPRPEDDILIKQLRANRKDFNSRITSIEFFQKQPGL